MKRPAYRNTAYLDSLVADFHRYMLEHNLDVDGAAADIGSGTDFEGDYVHPKEAIEWVRHQLPLCSEIGCEKIREEASGLCDDHRQAACDDEWDRRHRRDEP